MSQKLLCVQRDRRGQLRVGEIYTFAYTLECARCKIKHTMVEEFPFVSTTDLVSCPLCGLIHKAPSHRGFKPQRFVPWNPDKLGVTEREVRRLYSPTFPYTEKA